MIRKTDQEILDRYRSLHSSRGVDYIIRDEDDDLDWHEVGSKMVDSTVLRAKIAALKEVAARREAELERLVAQVDAMTVACAALGEMHRDRASAYIDAAKAAMAGVMTEEYRERRLR